MSKIQTIEKSKNGKTMKRISRYAFPMFVSALASTAAMGQSSDHKGTSVQLGVLGSKLDLSSSQTGESAGSSRSTLGNLSIGHLKELDDNWLVGFVAGFNLSDTKLNRGGVAGQTYGLFEGGGGGWENPPVVATENSNYTYTPGGGNVTRLSRKASLQMQLGYALNKKQLFLTKVGYHRAKLSKTPTGGAGSYGGECLNDSVMQACQESVNFWGLDSSGGSTAGKANLNGYSFGVGYRHQLQNNWFMQVDAQKIFYQKSSLLSVKPTVTDFSLSLGYKF